MGIPRQEYWSGLLFPSPGDLLAREMEPASPASPPLAGTFFTTSATWEALSMLLLFIYFLNIQESHNPG